MLDVEDTKRVMATSIAQLLGSRVICRGLDGAKQELRVVGVQKLFGLASRSLGKRCKRQIIIQDEEHLVRLFVRRVGGLEALLRDLELGPGPGPAR